jgi:hypothetical protein
MTGSEKWASEVYPGIDAAKECPSHALRKTVIHANLVVGQDVATGVCGHSTLSNLGGGKPQFAQRISSGQEYPKSPVRQAPGAIHNLVPFVSEATKRLVKAAWRFRTPPSGLAAGSSKMPRMRLPCSPLTPRSPPTSAKSLRSPKVVWQATSGPLLTCGRIIPRLRGEWNMQSFSWMIRLALRHRANKTDTPITREVYISN